MKRAQGSASADVTTRAYRCNCDTVGGPATVLLVTGVAAVIIGFYFWLWWRFRIGNAAAVTRLLSPIRLSLVAPIGFWCKFHNCSAAGEFIAGSSSDRNQAD